MKKAAALGEAKESLKNLTADEVLERVARWPVASAAAPAGAAAGVEAG